MGHCWDVKLLDERGREFNALGDALRGGGYGFDLLDDEALTSMARVANGRLRTATESFEILVMPKAEGVSRAAVERCVELVTSGGRVLFTGMLPVHSMEGGTSDSVLADLMKELFGDKLALASAGQAVWNNRGRGAAGFAPSADEAVRMLKDVVTPELRTSDDVTSIYAYRRRLDDGDLYLVFNHNDGACRTTVTVSATGHPQVWDPMSGQRAMLDSYRIGEHGTAMPLEFEPYEMKVLFLTRDKVALAIDRKRDRLADIAVPGPFRFRIEDTMSEPHLAWNFKEVRAAWTSKQKGGLQVPVTLPAGDWSEHGLKYFSGIGHYETTVTLASVPEGGRAILCLGRVGVSAEVTVNGKRGGYVFFAPYELDVTRLVKEGANDVRVSVANTLSNYFSQFVELDGRDRGAGGDTPERRVSGLLGPVTVRIEK